MLNSFTVSLETIMNKYSDLDDFFKASINSLFSGEGSVVKVVDATAANMIKDDKNNDLASIDVCNGKTGVYVFWGQDGLPEYIGKGGTSRSTDVNAKDLRYRISQELSGYKGNSQNTLSKNIMEIDSILESRQVTAVSSVDKIKSYNIRALIVGPRLVDDSVNIDVINKTEALETILIALLPTKYNK